MQGVFLNDVSGHLWVEERQNIAALTIPVPKSLFQLRGHCGLITLASKMSSWFAFPEVAQVTNQTLLFLCSKEINWTHNTHITPKSSPKNDFCCNLYVQTVTQRKHFQTSVAGGFLHRIQYSKCWRVGWQCGMGLSILGYAILKSYGWLLPKEKQIIMEPACLYLSVQCIIVLRFFKGRVVEFFFSYKKWPAALSITWLLFFLLGKVLGDGSLIYKNMMWKAH